MLNTMALNADVLIDTKEIHTKDANLNAQSLLNVVRNMFVGMVNVSILALTYVEKMLSA